MNFLLRRCTFFSIKYNSNIAYHFAFMFVIFMERLYHHPHFTDRGIDPETTLAGSWQNWDLKARSLALSPAFSPITFQPPRLHEPFSEPWESKAGCLLLTGNSFQVSDATAKEGRVPEAKENGLHTGAVCASISLLHRGRRECLTHLGGGDYENQ